MHERQLMLLMVAYIGPDVLLPVASALAAIGGMFLMFGRRVVGFFRMIGQRIGRLFGKH